MDGTRSREALSAFLSYLAEKGLMENNTVQARKAAVSKVFGILNDDEALDITVIDVDDVADRFSRLHGRSYTPASLLSYKSRLKSSVEDFKSYLANPMSFRPSVGRPKSAAKAGKDASQAPASAKENSIPTPELVRTPVKLPTDNLLPIQIRQDLTVNIQGIPFDLSKAEANKIANVILALAG